jgi:hypothetical protein
LFARSADYRAGGKADPMIAPVSQMPRLSKRRRGRYAVLLLETSGSWRPASPQSMPPKIGGAVFLARGLKATEAATVAQAWNLEHLGDRYTYQWAVVVSSMFPVVQLPDAVIVVMTDPDDPSYREVVGPPVRREAAELAKRLYDEAAAKLAAPLEMEIVG